MSEALVHDEEACPDCQAGSCTIANPALRDPNFGKKLARKPVLSDAAFLLVFAVACVAATMFVQVDKAVAWSWPNNPYSPVWFWLNPNANTDLPYRLYLAAFEAIAFGAMIQMVRWKPKSGLWTPLPFKVAFVNILVVMIFVMIHWQENITVVAFAWVAYWLWPWFFTILQKAPIGWSWNFQDAHVDCLRTCYFLDGNKIAVSLIDSFVFRDVFHYFVYALVVFAFVYPILAKRDITLRRVMIWIGRNVPPFGTRWTKE